MSFLGGAPSIGAPPPPPPPPPNPPTFANTQAVGDAASKAAAAAAGGGFDSTIKSGTQNNPSGGADAPLTAKKSLLGGEK